MSAGLWSPQNWALPLGVPKLGRLLHPGSSQHFIATFTWTYIQNLTYSRKGRCSVSCKTITA